MRAHDGANERHDREREALRRLARIFAEEARGGVLDEALSALLDGTRLEVGGAFTADSAVLTLVAERGTGAPGSALAGGDLRQALANIAEHVTGSRRPFRVADVSAADLALDAREALLNRGFSSFAAQPVKHRREVVAVFVLLARTPTALDAGVVGFIETIGHMVALALDRDRRSEREAGYREELAATTNMATLGVMTSSVTHEMQRKMGSLLAHLGDQARIIGDLREGATDWTRPMLAELSEQLAEMTAASGQMTAWMEQLDVLSRRDSVAETLDASALARDGLALVRGELKRRGVWLTEEYTPQCFLSGRRDNLLRILLTLVVNAVEACASATHESPRIAVRTMIEGSRAIIAVDDSGPALLDDEMFVPRGPALARPQRSGLALHRCHELVSTEHGTLEAVTLDEGHTSLRLSLPRVEVPLANQSATSAPTDAPPGEDADIRRVFMVDDDELFTRTLKRTLAPNEVRTASTASEAEMILLDPSYAPHVVLCDVGLPGMTGDVLHARVASKRPLIAQRFVFVTGGACSAAEAHYLRASGCATLRKPFSESEILESGEGLPPVGSRATRERPFSARCRLAARSRIAPR